MTPAAERFFSRCRNPISVSNLITALASGNPISASRVPVELLPCVVLLTTIGLRSYDQQIVDDYVVLLDRMTEVMRDPTTTHRDFDHVELYMVSAIMDEGPRGNYFLDTHPEAGYMFQVYEQLINTEVDSLFASTN